LVNIQDQKRHKICFTHGDAHSGNFLVRGGKIVAFIDFEMSVFFPEHLEYTTAMTTAQNDALHDDTFWKQELGKFLNEYSRELEGEIIRQKIFGKYGFRVRMLQEAFKNS
jgi:aminoglycoside phosphotransferase (APT) family kinase protein